MINSITFLGDVFLDKKYTVDIELENYIFNLEFPLSNSGIPAKNKINLYSNSKYIKETFGKLPIAVCLSNNHIMDYGEGGFKDTIRFLDKNNIRYFGAGNKQNNFNNPLFLNVGNITIALFGYTCPSTSAVFGDDSQNGSAKLDLNLIEKDLRNNKDYFKIVHLHWGMEEIPYPRYEDIQIAHKIIDMGADLIIGHHAHVMQPIELYKGKRIFYGLGNCIFPNFNLNSYHNGKIFTRKSKKINLQHNKESIAVTLDKYLEISFKTLEFKKQKLYENNKIKVPNFIPRSENEFKIKLKKDERSIMLRNAFLYPKMPRLRHFIKLIGK